MFLFSERLQQLAPLQQPKAVRTCTGLGAQPRCLLSPAASRAAAG